MWPRRLAVVVVRRRRPYSVAACEFREPMPKSNDLSAVHNSERTWRPPQRQMMAVQMVEDASSDLTHSLGLGLESAPALPPGLTFRLDPDVVARFAGERPPFGFNGLGELVYRRTYARLCGDGAQERREEWFETVARVVNGTFSMQHEWADLTGAAWDEDAAQRLAADMYERIFRMRFLPPGRGLWAMGSKLTTERRLYAALNNCAFVSTVDLADNPALPFCFLMDLSMLGVGVGFDTLGAGTVTVRRPGSAAVAATDAAAGGSAGAAPRHGEATHVAHPIADSREGWCTSLQALLEAYFCGAPRPRFDYGLLRPAGAPIRGFGGVSQGAEPLEELHVAVGDILEAAVGAPLTVTALVDIMNLIGRCVVAGNVRRTAEIAFGDPESAEYLDLKNYAKNPRRRAFGWTSNNSVLARPGMDYADACERVRVNGEPGFAWLDNMRTFGRMNGVPDLRDRDAAGGNPCLEQTLHSHELCCLVETFPDRHDDLDDFKATLESAFLYAKTVTLGATHWPRSNAVLLANRRVGCSMSGLAQFVSRRGLHELRRWCEESYDHLRLVDKSISEQFGVNESIKVTSVKPSGTVSLLAGATPGMHFPEARMYIRRVRLAKGSELVAPLVASGYPVEPCASDPAGTVVVEVPVDVGAGVRTANEVSMWEQLSFAAFLQRHWSDNQVSCTVTFDPATEGASLSHALDYFQYQLKGVSFLPRTDVGAFPQMPYEAISREEYERRAAQLKPLDFRGKRREPGAPSPIEEMPDKFCDTLFCDTGIEDCKQ